jgi:MOSC domain-containing protein YiiM
MQGTIVQVSISFGGLPKRGVSGGLITSLGIEGDRHAHPGIHGGPRKAILIVASEVIEELVVRGYPLFHGALGENLTTRGLTIRDIRIGDRLRVGGATLEITEPRGPCTALDVYGERLKEEISDDRVRALDHSSPRWGMSGFYASVVEPGAVRPNDIISVVAKLA